MRLFRARLSLVLLFEFFEKTLVSVLLLIALLVLSGCSINPTQAQLQRQALGLSVEHFQNGVTVKDDAFETSAILSTQKGVVPPRQLLQKTWSDEFVRGFINKKTGAKSYQVYVILDRYGWGWVKPYRANFGSPLRTVPTVRIDREKICTKKKQPCTRREVVGFGLPPGELRRVVETASAGDLKTKVWGFKIKTKDGSDYVGTLPLAEIIGLYRAMQAYKPVPTN